MRGIQSFLIVVITGLGVSLSAADKKSKKGWHSLFDGLSTAQWRGFKKSDFPEKGWVIEDRCLKHQSKGGGGDIITKEKFSEFDLRFEWKVAPAANSGVKYFIMEERGAPIGHEYQVLDDDRHPDGKKGVDRHTAAFYDVLPAKDKKLRPVGQFNQSRILVKGKKVEHWLNGRLVLGYRLGSPELKAAIAQSKFRKVKGFGEGVSGHILLQDHGDVVFYRNIRIRDLSR